MEGFLEFLGAIGEIAIAALDSKKKSGSRYVLAGFLVLMFFLVAGVGVWCWLDHP